MARSARTTTFAWSASSTSSGIHASPTCVMSYGDNGDCIGELVGRENEGLARDVHDDELGADQCRQPGARNWPSARPSRRLTFASERIQSARAGSPDRTPVAIVEHPDVRRMLLRMKALTEGARALLYYTAGQVDRGSAG